MSDTKYVNSNQNFIPLNPRGLFRPGNGLRNGMGMGLGMGYNSNLNGNGPYATNCPWLDNPVANSQIIDGEVATNNLVNTAENRTVTQVIDTNLAQQNSIFPPATTILQSGLFGAILGAGTSAISNFSEFKQGKKSKDNAISDVAKSAAQGAATMVIASFANHIVKKNPVLGITALVAGGIGAYVIAKNKADEQQNIVVESKNTANTQEIKENV